MSFKVTWRHNFFNTKKKKERKKKKEMGKTTTPEKKGNKKQVKSKKVDITKLLTYKKRRKVFNQNCKRSCIISKVVDGLYISDCSYEREDLDKKKITCIINCAKEITCKELEQIIDLKGIEYVSLRMDDRVDEKTQNNFRKSRQFIRNRITKGDRILVHCVNGVSRSAAICSAFLIKEKKISWNDAVALVKSKRSRAHPHQPFEIALVKFEGNKQII